MELYLYSAARHDPRHLPALILSQQLSWVYEFSVLALEPAEHLGEHGTGDGGEQVQVATVRAWLRRDVHGAVAADLVAAEEVPGGHGEHELGPAAHVGGLEG